MSRHAFLVEDNPTIRDNLIPTLAELSDVQVVGTAAGENEAVDWLKHHVEEADMVILDLFLAQGSGIGVLQGLADLKLNVPVVVLTNYATDDIRDRCKRLGAVALFDKSNDLDAFLAFCSRVNTDPEPRPGTRH